MDGGVTPDGHADPALQYVDAQTDPHILRRSVRSLSRTA